MTTPSPPEADAPHSAEYLGDSRDFWWNPDFVALIGQRWDLARCRRVLDAGCGAGHWGRVLAPTLAPDATLVGVDREPAWIERASREAHAAGLAHRFAYRQGAVEALPFDDASFDLVTCQTVLIHVGDVERVVREFLRVLRPGGLLAVAEPNNMAGIFAGDSTRHAAPVAEVLDIVRLKLTCERGKAALGLGDNSVGELLPGLFARIGLADVRVFQSDKASAVVPPYDTTEQRAVVREWLDWIDRGFWCWSRDEALRYFLGGGGDATAFDALWAVAMRANEQARQGLAARTLHAAGGGLHYLVSARKP